MILLDTNVVSSDDGRVGILNAQIAAIARTHGVTVATRDVGGFADTGVSVVNPFTI